MTETLYKLTDQNQETQGGTKWDVGVTHRHKKSDNPQLCSDGVFHEICANDESVVAAVEKLVKDAFAEVSFAKVDCNDEDDEVDHGFPY